MITAESNQPEEKALPSARHTMSLASMDLLQTEAASRPWSHSRGSSGQGGGAVLPHPGVGRGKPLDNGLAKGRVEVMKGSLQSAAQ